MRRCMSRYFKHSNFAVFVRQLNRYGVRSTFRNISKDSCEFSDPFFR